MGKRVLLLALLALAACGAQVADLQPAAAPAPPTATAAPTATPVPPTATAQPTSTSVPPTTTSVPPTTTSVPPTATAEPTATPVPPTATVVRKATAAVRLVIPAIDLDRALVSVGLDARRIPIVPQHDIGWYNLSAGPGQGENIVLWGHVLRFKATPKIPAPFARLKELPVGATLTLYDADGVAYAYEVIEQVWATPDEVAYILPKGRELVTMVSCIGDKVVAGAGVEMTHRLITIAAPAGGQASPSVELPRRY